MLKWSKSWKTKNRNLRFTLVLLPLFMVSTLLAVILYRRKHSRWLYKFKSHELFVFGIYFSGHPSSFKYGLCIWKDSLVVDIFEYSCQRTSRDSGYSSVHSFSPPRQNCLIFDSTFLPLKSKFRERMHTWSRSFWCWFLIYESWLWRNPIFFWLGDSESQWYVDLPFFMLKSWKKKDDHQWSRENHSWIMVKSEKKLKSRRSRSFSNCGNLTLWLHKIRFSITCVITSKPEKGGFPNFSVTFSLIQHCFMSHSLLRAQTAFRL